MTQSRGYSRIWIEHFLPISSMNSSRRQSRNLGWLAVRFRGGALQAGKELCEDASTVKIENNSLQNCYSAALKHPVYPFTV